MRVTRNEHEECLVETSVNSTRVSLRLRQVEPLDALLVRKFARFLAQRAEAFGVLRREPLPGYDVSFLITGAQSGGGGRAEALTAFIVRFLEDFDREMNLLKLSVNTAAFADCSTYMTSDGQSYVPLVISMAALQKVLSGERAVTTVTQLHD